MTTRQDIRIGVLFLTHLLLFLGIGSCNNMISRWGLYVHLDGLFLTSAALYLGPIAGGLLAGYFALSFDASHPVSPFGMNLLVWLVTYAWIRLYTAGARHSARFHAVLLALVANQVILVVKGVLALPEMSAWGAYAGAWGIEFLASALAVVFVSGWFLALEEGFLIRLGFSAKAPSLEER